MNEARRERIRVLIQTLGKIHEQVHDLAAEEENAFDDRSKSSKETDSGKVSKDAVDCLFRASDDVETAIGHMQCAIGDDSIPEPPAPPLKRRY
jgi:hypothetical protein